MVASTLVEELLVVVVHARAPLRVDHLALALDRRGIEREAAHAVRLHAEDQLERVLGKDVVVDRHVLRRVRVVGPAVRFHDPIEITTRIVLWTRGTSCARRSGEPRDAVVLVSAPDLVPDVERNVRDVVVRPDDHAKPVRKGLGRDIGADLGGRGRARLGGLPRLCGGPRALPGARPGGGPRGAGNRLAMRIRSFFETRRQGPP